MLLEGKVIAITGAGRGIGAACAEAAASAGASVVVNDIDDEQARDTVARIIHHGGKATVHCGDISDWNDAEAMVRTALSSFGQLDGLVNNAAIIRHGMIDAVSQDDARSVVGVNVLGTIFAMRHAVLPMLAQGCGTVVNLTSITQCGMAAMSTYAATKGAIASLTYSWALELWGRGVRVNAVTPTGETSMSAASDVYRASVGASARQALSPSAASNVPAVLYFLSDLSANVTGQNLKIRGAELNIMSHPARTAPTLQSDAWTAETIANAMSADLAGSLQPLGDLLFRVAVP